MSSDQTFHYRNGERLQSCQQAHTKKAYLGETIGQGPAKRNRLALLIEPVDELLGEFHGSRLILFRPFRIILFHNHSIDQAIEVNGKGNIVILLSGISIPVPSFTQIESFQSFQVFFQHLGAVPASHLFHGNVHQYGKEDPVADRQGMLVNFVQIIA